VQCVTKKVCTMQLRSYLAFFQIIRNDVYRRSQNAHGEIEYGGGNT
jgi:hypothetical protein